MSWAEPFRKLGVRANADIPRDAIQARAFGAEGIGLCRTEHMFFEKDRIPHMQAMILTDNEKDRRAALKKLLPMQRSDFIGVFRAMDGFPVTIRTLDPPLHEFLPRREELMVDIAILPHADAKEMANQAAIVNRIAQEVFTEKEQKVDYLVGTMIELPRAALVADEIAKESQFFSFGTNDLTQTTFGFSRDDVNKILPTYLAEGILKQ